MRLWTFFRKLEGNIPFLDAIKQVPHYEKFLIELCTSKNKLNVKETIKLNKDVSAILLKRLPSKLKGPLVFTIPYNLESLSVPQAMLDLGASINVLHYSI